MLRRRINFSAQVSATSSKNFPTNLAWVFIWVKNGNAIMKYWKVFSPTCLQAGLWLLNKLLNVHVFVVLLWNFAEETFIESTQLWNQNNKGVTKSVAYLEWHIITKLKTKMRNPIDINALDFDESMKTLLIVKSKISSIWIINLFAQCTVQGPQSNKFGFFYYVYKYVYKIS